MRGKKSNVSETTRYVKCEGRIKGRMLCNLTNFNKIHRKTGSQIEEDGIKLWKGRSLSLKIMKNDDKYAILEVRRGNGLRWQRREKYRRFYRSVIRCRE